MVASYMVLVGAVLATLGRVAGHGMMLDPPNRSSLWRYDGESPINYDDNQNYCGGFYIQWYVLEGKCGVCGDRYDAEHPQENENTGKYGRGKIAAVYEQGSVVNVTVKITANHKGYFNFSLCVLEDASAPETDECFFDLPLADGTTKHPVPSGVNDFQSLVVLPPGLTCERCVLRWTYTAGNNWGICEDGTGATGCGPQEIFRSCADVAIY